MYKRPEKYIGTFERQRGENEYKLVQKDSIPSLEDVYQIKDPGD